MKMELRKSLLLLALGVAGLTQNAIAANTVSPSNVPLVSADANTLVKPNLMYIVDDSVNQAKGYLPEDLSNNNCRSYTGNTANSYSATCFIAPNGTPKGDILNEQYALEAPMLAFQINKLAYNPNVTYTAAIKADGTYYANQSITSALDEPFLSGGVAKNLSSSGLTGQLKDIYYCTSNLNNPTLAQLQDRTVCRRNGVDSTGTQTTSQLGIAFNINSGFPNATFKYRVLGPQVDGAKVTAPTYYTLSINEYCDNNLVNCAANNNSYTVPATVRYCKTIADASNTSTVTGSVSGAAKCQKNYDTANGYIYPRYASFIRNQITSTENGNFANWFTYYRTRFLMLKTTSGMAFKDVDSNKRVGLISMNPGATVTSSNYAGINDFDASQKSTFYSTLYGLTIKTGGAPIREALSRIGRHYAGKTTGINAGMSNSSVQYSCQQNFSFIATESYWDGTAQGSSASGLDLAGNAIGNVDNTNTGFATRASGSYDGNIANTSGTLADVAMYYYQTDLRNAGDTVSGQDVGTNNVPLSLVDTNPQQHMVTYAISLGLSGFMSYSPNYIENGNADLQNIKNGASGACSWTTGVCNWPVPVVSSNSTIDDLWHATINSRGQYFNAQSSSDIVSGLTGALNTLVSKTASSAAAATSSPNITSGDNYLFYTTYRTNKWDGEISAKTIDPISGVISNTTLWSARDMLNSSVSASSDSRNIYYVSKSNQGTSVLKNFVVGSMSTTEKNYFTNPCTNNKITCNNLFQVTLDAGSPSNVVNYLRGQTGNEEINPLTPYFRNRDYVLGDIVNSAPVYVGAPKYNWPDTTYTDFATANASRTPYVYAGGNDGMIHAFRASTGQEDFAVIPAVNLPNLVKLADKNYAANHRFFVDGPITVMDAKISGTWKTMLIAGMGAGGKGYIALDITDPANPSVMWELCNDATLCSKSETSDLGLTFGNAIITQRYYDNTWVVYVSGGYDSSSGKGIILELDAATGTTLRKLVTGTGVPGQPAGIGKINTYSDTMVNGYAVNTAKFLYAGDLDGNIWKWDLTNASNLNANKLGTVKDASGNAQPITTKIEIGKINSNPILFIGTGRYLNTSDIGTTSVQSVYAIKDDNSNTNYGNLRTNSNIVQQIVAAGATSSTTTANAVDWTSKIGWYFDLTSQVGERVNIDMTLQLGNLNIVTNVPGNAICTSGGSSWYYQVDFKTGGALANNNNILAKKLFNGLTVGQVIVRLAASGVMKNYVTDAGGAVTPYGMATGSVSSSNNVGKANWKEIYKK
jgi:type IV pilus assembly protein PilY1